MAVARLIPHLISYVRLIHIKVQRYILLVCIIQSNNNHIHTCTYMYVLRTSTYELNGRIKTTLRLFCYLHIPRSSHRLQRGCAGGGVDAPSSAGVRQPGAWRGVPRLPWRVLPGVLLGLRGRPSLRHLWLGRPEPPLPWQERREEAFPDPCRRERRLNTVLFDLRE